MSFKDLDIRQQLDFLYKRGSGNSSGLSIPAISGGTSGKYLYNDGVSLSWVVAGGVGWPLTGAFALTGDVIGDLAGHTFTLGGVNSTLALNSNGVLITLGVGKTFEAAADYTANYTSLSYVTKGNLDLKANLASPTFTGTVSGISSSMIGLGNVNNTSDASKPVSTATQTALNLKLDIANPIYTGKLSLTAITANAALNTSTLWLQGMDIGTYFGDASVAISIASGRTYLMNFYNAGAANIRMQLTSVGNFGIGDFAVGTGNHIEQRVLASNKIGYFLRGAAGQTADLMNWADNTPTVLGGITASGGIFTGTTSLSASAQLEVASTTKAFLPPRMTKAQRDLISPLVGGLVIHQTDNTPGLREYNGTNWVRYTETVD